MVRTFVDIVVRDCGSVAPTIDAVGPLDAAPCALCRRDLNHPKLDSRNPRTDIGLLAIGEEKALIGHVR